MKKDYCDKVLIKLKRRYSKDETVSSLSKKLSEVEIENGKLSSYVCELENEIKLLKSNKQERKIINKEARVSAQKEELYKALTNRVTNLSRQVVDLKLDKEVLLRKLNGY